MLINYALTNTVQVVNCGTLDSIKSGRPNPHDRPRISSTVRFTVGIKVSEKNDKGKGMSRTQF